MNKSKQKTRIKILLIAVRLLAVALVAKVLVDSGVLTGARDWGYYVMAVIFALLITAVFLDKYLIRLANYLAKKF
jgi:hypothetical protein